MTKICFAGAYGIKSQGDDAALLALAALLRQRLGDFEGLVIARHAAEKYYERYGFRSLANIEWEQKSLSQGKWFKGLNCGDDRAHLKRLQAEISASDLLVFGAGNFLIDLTIDLLRGPIPYLFVLTLMAKMARRPIMWLGFSVGPFLTDYGQKLSRLAAELADAVTVREREAEAQLRRIGYDGPIMVLPDPVLGLAPGAIETAQRVPSWRQSQERGRPVVAVSARGLPGGSVLTTEDYLERMALVCDRLAEEQGATLYFIPQCTYTQGEAEEDDCVMARRIAARMKKADQAVIAAEDLSVAECLSLYLGAEAALCTRLHGCVFAAMGRVPPVAISYNSKVANFMTWLGRPELSVALEDFSLENVVARVEEAIKNRTALSKDIAARIEAGRREVGRYADLACELLGVDKKQ